jgi:hypothetical protein
MATMTNTDLLPATVLKRKAIVYVRQSSQSRFKTISRASAGNMTWSRKRGGKDFGISRSSMMVSAAPPAAWWPGQVSTSSWHGFGRPNDRLLLGMKGSISEFERKRQANAVQAL